jgi:hypothetical protein
LESSLSPPLPASLQLYIVFFFSLLVLRPGCYSKENNYWQKCSGCVFKTLQASSSSAFIQQQKMLAGRSNTATASAGIPSHDSDHFLFLRASPLILSRRIPLKKKKKKNFK